MVQLVDSSIWSTFFLLSKCRIFLSFISKQIFIFFLILWKKILFSFNESLDKSDFHKLKTHSGLIINFIIVYALYSQNNMR